MDFSEILTQSISHPTSSFSRYAWLISKKDLEIVPVVPMTMAPRAHMSVRVA